MFDVCVIGHLTWDRIAIPGKAARKQPGGVSYYAAMACRSLGLETAVITRIAEADAGPLLADLRRAGVAVFCSYSRHTTEFENLYPGGDLRFRVQRVRARAARFSAADLRDVRASVFHLGPLTGGDIPAAVIGEIAGKGGLVSLDVQGLVRRVIRGEVRPQDWREKEAGLACVDILKANEEEARILAVEDDAERAARILAGFGPKEVVVTLGGRGSLIYCQGRIHRIPAFRPRRLADATGCGDTYIAGYLFHRLRSNDIEAAGRFAAAAASLKIERFGPFTAKQNDVAAYVETSAPQAPAP